METNVGFSPLRVCERASRLKRRTEGDANLDAAPLSPSNTWWWPSNRKARQNNAKLNKTDSGLKMSFCVEIRCLVRLRRDKKKKLQGTFAGSATKQEKKKPPSCPSKICSSHKNKGLFPWRECHASKATWQLKGGSYRDPVSIWKSGCWLRPEDLYGQDSC